MQISKGTVIKFRFDDGSTLDWRITEPTTVERLHDSIDRWAALNEPTADDEIRREQ